MTIKFTKTVSYTIERYPERCNECPCFSMSQYSCMNERGVEGHCALDYLEGDMRDFRGEIKFPKCQIENDARVTIGSFD